MTRASRLLTAAGIAASIVIAVLANMLSARHYARWDWTESGLYSISRVTEQTLRSITQPVDVYVLLSREDPMTLTMRHLLDAYQAIAPLLKVEFIDPDRQAAALRAIQQTHNIAAAQTEDGRVATDAQIIVARGDRRHFITSSELIDVAVGEELTARSQVEATLTAAIRMVTREKAPRVCFTSGHGEANFDDGGMEGLLAARARFEKLNYESVLLEDGVRIDDCALVVVAGPTTPMPSEDVGRLKVYFEGGGDLLLFVGPTDSGVDVGLDPVLAMAGLRKRTDFVFEREPNRVLPIGQGEAFIAEPQKHPVTQGLVEVQGAINVIAAMCSSFEVIDDAAVKPSALLLTSDQAFGMRDFVSWAKTRQEPQPVEGDSRGPLGIAYAVELPKLRANDEHGPRMVVVGSKNAIIGANWSDERLQGSALFVESALSWLASEPVVLDIARKPARKLGGSISEDMLGAAALKVVVFLPLSMVLFGIAIGMRRKRRKDDRAREKAPASSKD